MRWLPRSLFGQLLLVLASGMLVAQLLSAAINLAERDNLLQTASGMQQVQRLADVVNLLDSMAAPERERIVAVLSVPPLILSLHDQPATGDGALPPGPRAQMFASMLRANLGDNRAIRVEPLAGRWAPSSRQAYPHRMDMMGGVPRDQSGRLHAAPLLRTQVQLLDGSWARFDAQLPGATAGLPWRLAFSLLMMFCAVLGLSLVAVRWVTRPLKTLAQAANALGQDIHQPPLPEAGPTEIRQAAHAFNTMQQQLVRLIDGRTQMLTAMSHDLKTPITRMRLRADLLDDDELRERFESDLKEMEAMVTHSLAFMRGLGDAEPRQRVDLMALLEGVQRDQQAMGRTVMIEGQVTQPLDAVASLLRRCLTNLIDNAVLYGGQATVVVEDTAQALVVRVCDAGPGLAADQLEKVFEPFYRVEASRSRQTGGTGLGLPIARNIARMHGGDVVLHNRPQGGLQATLTLPRQSAGK